MITRLKSGGERDFTRDVPASGQGHPVLAAVDVHTQGCVALRSTRRFTGEDEAGILGEAGAEPAALPDVISVDPETGFTPKCLDHWPGDRVRPDCSRPAKSNGQHVR